ncbi:hypothetical protein AAC387_Pa03g0674 [Persea americana]
MAAGTYLISPCWCYRWRPLALGKSTPIFSSTARPSRSPFLARASNQPPTQEPDANPNSNNNTSSNAFSSPDDLNYLWKLVAGSVGGAAVIKYGSVIFPDITKPNILQALAMIMVPVFVSVIVLIKESSMTENQDPF